MSTKASSDLPLVNGGFNHVAMVGIWLWMKYGTLRVCLRMKVESSWCTKIRWASVKVLITLLLTPSWIGSLWPWMAFSKHHWKMGWQKHTSFAQILPWPSHQRSSKRSFVIHTLETQLSNDSTWDRHCHSKVNFIFFTIHSTYSWPYRYSGLREMADLVNRNVTLWWRTDYRDLANAQTLHDYFLGTDMVQVAIERNTELAKWKLSWKEDWGLNTAAGLTVTTIKKGLKLLLALLFVIFSSPGMSLPRQFEFHPMWSSNICSHDRQDTDRATTQNEGPMHQGCHCSTGENKTNRLCLII